MQDCETEKWVSNLNTCYNGFWMRQSKMFFIIHSFPKKEIIVCLISHLCFVGGGWDYTSAHKHLKVNCLLQYFFTLFLCQDLSLKLVLTDWLDKLDSKPKDPSTAASPALVLITSRLCPIQLFKRMWVIWAQIFIFLWQEFFQLSDLQYHFQFNHTS